MLASYGVMESSAFEGHFQKLTAGFVHCLLNRQRHLAGLALAHTNTAVPITDHSECSEPENTTTFHRFADPVNGNHLLAQSVIALFGVDPCLHLCHCDSFCLLELQTTLTGSVGECLDAAVIAKS